MTRLPMQGENCRFAAAAPAKYGVYGLLRGEREVEASGCSSGRVEEQKAGSNLRFYRLKLAGKSSRSRTCTRSFPPVCALLSRIFSSLPRVSADTFFFLSSPRSSALH